MLTDLGSWLREQRQAHGWSAAEMARQLQRAARACGDTALPGTAILASYIRRWEHETIAPTERYRLHYCKALGIQPAEFGPPEPGHMAPGTVDILAAGMVHNAGLAGCWPGDVSGYRDVSKEHNAAEGEDRRTEPDVPLGHLMTVIAEESLDFGEWADTSNVGDATLEHYAAQVRRLAGDYVHAPPYPLLLDARRLRDRVFAKLQGHQRPGQTRDLYLIAAQVCGMLAWISGDLGYQRAAQTHAWTAWVSAEQANHDGARAWVRATQSKLAYWDARHIESAQLAEDGLRYSSADSGRVMLALFQARSLARLGRDEEAVGALAQARTALEQAGPDEIGGLWGIDQARYHHLAGSTHQLRHDPRQVLAETGQALELFEAADPRERNYGAQAHTRVDQAQAQLLLRDLDGASLTLRSVLSLAPESRYEPLTQHLGHVGEALAQPEFHDATLARELQEEIETYRRESIVNDLHD